MSGKGSGRRPSSVSHDEFSRRWDMIFGGHDKNTPAVPPIQDSTADAKVQKES